MITFDDICRHYDRISISFQKENEKNIRRIALPDSICPLAFHSAYAYILTLAHGGWFNWVGHNDHVIVNCPSPDGIVMRVEKPAQDSPQKVKIKVVRKKKHCCRGYEAGDFLSLDCDPHNLFGLSVAEKVIPLISNIARSGTHEFSVDLNGETIRCLMKFREK